MKIKFCCTLICVYVLSTVNNIAAQTTQAEYSDIGSDTTIGNREIDLWSVGIRMGMAIPAMIYTSEDYGIYSHRPYARGTIGFWAQRDIIAGLSIRPEFSFTGSGVLLKTNDIQYGLHFRNFDIRAGLLYTFLRDKKVQPYVLFAPNLNFVINGKVTYKDDSGKDLSMPITKGNIYPVNFSMLFGGGVRIPIHVKDFNFFVNAEIGYNIGCVNTFSTNERNGSSIAINGINSTITGKRLNSAFEIAVTVGVPLNQIFRKSKKQNKLSKEELRTQLQQQQSANYYNEELAKYNERLAPSKRVGKSIKMYVTPNVTLETTENGTTEMNLKLEFAYETVTEGNFLFDKDGDDYPPGAYLPELSKACMATLGYMQEQLNGELKKYIKPGTHVTVRISGETDGTPIRRRIPYNGEYGDFNKKLIFLNGVPSEMTVTRQTGITQNGQLGFLRTQGVQKYLETQIDALKETQNNYIVYAFERKEKGSQYRKISVEVTIHNAFGNELQQAAIDYK